MCPAFSCHSASGTGRTIQNGFINCAVENGKKWNNLLMVSSNMAGGN
jgi:hypothetical protein